MIRVNHTIASIDKSTGGPARSVTHLMSNILEISNDICLDLTTLASETPILNSFKKDASNIYFFKKKIEFKNYYDLYHAQGIWEKPMHDMVKEARRENKPYVISIRGMLEPWSLKQSSFKKKIALQLYQFKDLKEAACLHATADMEVKSIRDLGLKNPIAMIPNGVNIDQFSEEIPVKVTDKKKMLFLSRIHSKKGIENLIEAWLQLENKFKDDWIIEIVGNGDSKYIESLKNLIIAKKLEAHFFILPPVFGKEKIALFREASLFVLPTFSENFGIVIAEALASYTPVITTKGAPWGDLDTHQCGWWIDIGVEPLKLALNKAMLSSSEELLDMGKNGRKLIKENYSMESVAKQMIELYNWVLTKENKPSFVDTI